MSVTRDISGCISIVTAATWAANGVTALVASRRAPGTLGPRQRARKWQWFALAGLAMIFAVWIVTGPSTGYPAVFWCLMAGYAIMLAWLLITDLGPWLRTRLKNNTSP
jgi:hypothetical protein